ncbi:5'-3' exoribonuclease 2-like [Juglans regia]|uniref:5'-3' exoribonuclease 2-like n=1 Tax=Juglans regia TaxID=51240 RepID=A0A6P9E6T9_JUGRE|nr:5'-3' exoribonuclease 2-like [Juglans regia]
MDRYLRVEKLRVETPIDANEIRITSQGRMRNYITYAMSLLQEKDLSEIVFKAMGRAINKTVTIVELIKRIVGLHQNTSIGSTDITNTWEPLEEGLLPLETTRHVSMITITLSKKEPNTSSVGYQAPLPAEQVKASTEFDYEGGKGSPNGRGWGRGGRGRGKARGNGFLLADYEDGGRDRGRGNARGSGRGRGRSFRGRGRGWYGGPQVDTQQDGGYHREAHVQGRGRGRGRGYRGRGRSFRSNGLI